VPGSSWLAMNECRDFITTGGVDFSLWFLATNPGSMKIVTSALCRPNLRDPRRSGCCAYGSSERASRKLTYLADASATTKTAFYVKNCTAHESIGSNGSSRKA